MINFFDLFSVDTLYIVLGLAGVSLITLILAIVALCKAAKLKKKYRSFMEGADGKSIESLIHEHLDEIESIRTVGEKNSAAVKDIYEKMQYTFQKVGIVKYDAFHEMGGKLSFALCMLDKVNNGYIINVMHSNNGCFAYIKEVVDGKSYIELGDEENQALQQAVAGRMGDADLGRSFGGFNNNECRTEHETPLQLHQRRGICSYLSAGRSRPQAAGSQEWPRQRFSGLDDPAPGL